MANKWDEFLPCTLQDTGEGLEDTGEHARIESEVRRAQFEAKIMAKTFTEEFRNLLVLNFLEKGGDRVVDEDARSMGTQKLFENRNYLFNVCGHEIRRERIQFSERVTERDMNFGVLVKTLYDHLQVLKQVFIGFGIVAAQG